MGTLKNTEILRPMGVIDSESSGPTLWNLHEIVEVKNRMSKMVSLVLKAYDVEPRFKP